MGKCSFGHIFEPAMVGASARKGDREIEENLGVFLTSKTFPVKISSK
jgi:hypothetical protein